VAVLAARAQSCLVGSGRLRIAAKSVTGNQDVDKPAP